ncbi:hypothetical protein B0H19DRAFT_1260335 [Mycena capillaripes]|nr:hypothetical protein B0H19DRAFT_1260335 [Mycena capillaripes]
MACCTFAPAHATVVCASPVRESLGTSRGQKGGFLVFHAPGPTAVHLEGEYSPAVDGISTSTAPTAAARNSTFSPLLLASLSSLLLAYLPQTKHERAARLNPRELFRT